MISHITCYTRVMFNLKQLPKEKLRNGKIGFLNLFKPLDIRVCLFAALVSFRHKIMLMQLSASLSQCSLSLILFPMLNFESFHLTFSLQKKVEKGDEERYLQSWLKILVQNLYTKSWRTEKNTKTCKTSIYLSQNVFEISWSSNHKFFPSPVNIILRNYYFPPLKFLGNVFQK